MPDVSSGRMLPPRPAGPDWLQTRLASVRSQRITRQDGTSQDVRETVMRVGVGRVDARIKVRVPIEAASPNVDDGPMAHLEGRRAHVRPEVRVSNLRIDGDSAGAWLLRESKAWAEENPAVALPVLAVSGAAAIAGAIAYGKGHGGIRLSTGSAEIVSFDDVTLHASAGIRVAGARAVDWDHAAVRAHARLFGGGSHASLGALLPREGRPRLEASWDKALGRDGVMGMFGSVDTRGDLAVGVQLNVTF
ncbi:MAG: hypothetical protein FJY99_12255 [Candidatus Sericytochromatia bacterium]|nr:hypothetical protein [Candidatus Tanganyikabacteria bacterium]